MKFFITIGIALILTLIVRVYIIMKEIHNTNDYINNLTMIGSISIITIVILSVLKYLSQIKTEKPSGELLEEEWEGIRKYQNPIPFGWGLSFIAVLSWLFWYWTIGYPTNSFSQIGQWNEEVKKFNTEFNSKWLNATKEDLVPMGESIYLVQCSPCHAVDAEGIPGLSQNLTIRLTEDSVLYAIKNGSNNFKTSYPNGMPAITISDDEAKILAEYISKGFIGRQPESYNTCAACHGKQGEGIAKLGPNLKIFDDKLVNDVLKDGKKGVIGEMPNFKNRLNHTQTKAIAAYLRSLSE